MIDLDDERALAASDPAGMLVAIGSLPRQCHEGYAAGRAAGGLPSADGLTAVTFCGMGGSAIAGDVLRSLYRERLGIPIDVQRSSILPAYCGPHTLVLASSYSGSTAETLSCFEEARDRGCRVIAVTSGGELGSRARRDGLGIVGVPGSLRPRAEFGYLTLATLGSLEAVGLLPSLEAETREAVMELEELARKLGPAVPRAGNDAKELAWRIGDRTPLIWGADGPASVAAARWKTQFNENAKVPAWAASLPELDHNEVVGWTRPAGESYFLVTLRHEGEPPDVAARFPASIAFASEAGALVEEVWAAGPTPLARLLSLVLMGDFTTAYHGLFRGVDPSPTEAIDRLKAAIGAGGV